MFRRTESNTVRGEPEHLTDLQRYSPEHGCDEMFYLTFAADATVSNHARSHLHEGACLLLWNETLLEQLANAIQYQK